MKTKNFIIIGGLLACFASVVFVAASTVCADEASESIPIATLKRTAEVDFHKEVLPLLRRSCLACHNASAAESDLVLETVETMLKGGTEGPAIVPGNSAESLLLQLAAFQREPFMPPEDNAADAPRLSSEELGLIQLWIDQGAKMGSGSDKNAIAWRAVPEAIAPVLSVVMDSAGDWAISGRGNRLFVYHVPSGRLVQELVDPAVTTGTAAHLDLVQSLAMAPDGDLVASGGFQTVKIWRRQPHRALAEAQLGDGVTCVAVHAASGRVAVGTRAGDIRVLDSNSGQQVGTLAGHEGSIAQLQFFQDGQKIVSAGADASIRVWQLDTASQLHQIAAPSEVLSLALVSEDNLVAVGCADNVIRLWPTSTTTDAENNGPVAEWQGHSGPVNCLSVPADKSNHVVSGSADGTVRIWDVDGGQELKKLEHGSPVTQVAVSKDGTRLASAGPNPGVKLWDAEGKLIADIQRNAQLEHEMKRQQQVVALAREEANAAQSRITELEKQIKEQDEALGKSREAVAAAEASLAEKQTASDQSATAKQQSETALQLAQSAAADAEKLLEAARKQQSAISQSLTELANTLAQAKQSLGEAPPKTLEPVATTLAAADQLMADHRKQQEQALTELTGKLEALKNAAQPALEEAKKQLEATTKAAEEAASALQAARKAKEESDINMAQAERDLARSKEALVEKTSEKDAWNQKAEQHEQASKTLEEAITKNTATDAHIVFSEDGRDVVIGTGSEVWICDAVTGKMMSRVELPESAPPAALAVSGAGDDARAWVVSAEGRLVAWNVQRPWVLERTIGSVTQPGPLFDRVSCLDIGPNGRLLAAGSGQPSRSGAVTVLDLTTGDVVHALPDAHSDTVYGVQFSPDGQWLATSGADRMARVFRVDSGELVRTLEGHTHHVLDVAWRANGKILATAGADQVIKIWDAETGEQKRTIAGMSKEVTSIEFVGISGRTLSSNGDGNVRLHESNDGKVVRTLSCPEDYVYDAAVTGDGQQVVAGGALGVLRVLDAENGKLLRAIE